MAYSYTWPLSLPTQPQKGFSESIGANVLRTPMDAGPAKMRLRSKKPSTMQLTYIMTQAQVTTFQQFVEDTLIYTSRFGYKHPRTGLTVEVRIVPQQEGQYYTIQYLAPGYWNVVFTIEVLP